MDSSTLVEKWFLNGRLSCFFKRERRTKNYPIQTISIFISVTDFPEVSTTACQHYSLITLQCFVPRRLVNARQKLLDFWSSVHLNTCGSIRTSSFLLYSFLVNSSFFCKFFLLILSIVCIKGLVQHWCTKWCTIPLSLPLYKKRSALHNNTSPQCVNVWNNYSTFTVCAEVFIQFWPEPLSQYI